MLRVQHVRSLLRGGLVAAWLGFVAAACQGPDPFSWHEASGFGGDAPSGAAGTFGSGAAGTSATGAAGTSMTGTAGSVLTGTAGSAGGSGGGGNSTGTGTAGTTGAAGNAGAAGRGGMMGAGGAVGGRGGSAGGAGSTGSAGATGSGGSAAGRGGTTGSAGASGRGGNSGSAGSGGGSAGRGGTGGAGRGGSGGTTGAGGSSCPLGGKLDCTAAGSLDITGNGLVVDFSTGQWNATTGKFCDSQGLDGSLSSFAGTGSMATAAVDTTAQNLKLNFTVTAGQYAGGRVNFDSCVDARAFNSVQFTASVTAGSLNGCAWQIQLQTQDQRPTTATNPTGGTCNATTTTCERYPAATLTAATATSTMFTTRFTAFSNPANSAVATPSQITGLQWQVNSNNGTGTCMVEIHIDNVRFVTQ